VRDGFRDRRDAEADRRARRRNPASDFAHRLAASDLEAANITADKRSGETWLYVWLPPSEVGAASSMAKSYGFEYEGETGSRSRSGRLNRQRGLKRYRFVR
jgi:hypothetical protein